MIKLCLFDESKQTIGGGWTFKRNLIKALNNKVIFTDWIQADVCLICGATMVSRETVEAAKKRNKKIVLRVDNIPRNSRNRNTGTSRLYDFAQMADVIVYQSHWAKEYIEPFIQPRGSEKPSFVILNGVDTDIFKPEGDKMPPDGKPQYLYVRFNRDETKRWEKAWYDYQMAQRKYSQAALWIVGNFSPQQVEYNFDFFMNERYKYLGIISNPEEMARIYRSTDILLLPYYNDACSNVFAEAQACGIKEIIHDGSGGLKEQEERGVINLEEMGKEYLKIFKNV